MRITELPAATASGSGKVAVAQGGVTRQADFDWGDYTPTLTNTLNVTSSSAHECYWHRIGNKVKVFGRVTVQPTSTGATVLQLSLPIASNMNNDGDCTGTANAVTLAGESAGIRADFTNDRAQMQWIATSAASRIMYFEFGYNVR